MLYSTQRGYKPTSNVMIIYLQAKQDVLGGCNVRSKLSVSYLDVRKEGKLLLTIERFEEKKHATFDIFKK